MMIRCCIGRAGAKEQMPLPQLFIEVVAFHLHILGFSGCSSGNTGYIPHFCGHKPVLIAVSFIYHKVVKAQLLKVQQNVLALLLGLWIHNILKADFQLFLASFDLLGCGILPVAVC